MILGQQIVRITNRNQDEFYIRVPVPLDEGARALVNRQLEPLVGLCVSADDVARFWADVEYLPTEALSLARAEYLYASSGHDWHTCCELAKLEAENRACSPDSSARAAASEVA